MEALHLPTIVALGFLVGMRHALEADHLAAVATLARESRGVRESAFRGAVWGLGHTLTLFLVGGVCLLLGGVMPDGFARAAEAGVGAMLVVLGVQVFVRMRSQGVHVHAHRHDDGTVHLHAHSHPPAADHPAEHRHSHRTSFPRRALVIGLVHGLAGSAALLLLALETTTSPWVGLLYIGVFGLGSVIGMAVLSAAIAVPFAATLGDRAVWLTRVYRGLEAAVGVTAVAVGVWVLVGAVAP
jgi:ABC-type nickel/cobalt efflux system permease component RcnA